MKTRDDLLKEYAELLFASQIPSDATNEHKD